MNFNTTICKNSILFCKSVQSAASAALGEPFCGQPPTKLTKVSRNRPPNQFSAAAIRAAAS